MNNPASYQSTARTQAVTLAPTADPSRPTRMRSLFRVFLDNRLAAVGVLLVLAMLMFCFLGPLVYRSQQSSTNLLDETLPPGAGHPLGTDSYGFDVLGRLMLGGQSSLEVGVASAFLATFFGSIGGAVAGYAGGYVDVLLMRIVDVLLAIPTLVLVLVVAAIFRPDLLMLILIISALSWLVPARLVLGETLALRDREFVQAVRQAGGSRRRIIARHLVPNAVPLWLTQPSRSPMQSCCSRC